MDDAETQVGQLAHTSTDDGHFGLALGEQTITEGFEVRIVLAGDDGWHVEQLAQMRWSSLGQTWASSHRRARFPLHRHQAEISGQLFGAVESLGSEQRGQVARYPFTYARNVSSRVFLPRKSGSLSICSLIVSSSRLSSAFKNEIDWMMDCLTSSGETANSMAS